MSFLLFLTSNLFYFLGVNIVGKINGFGIKTKLRVLYWCRSWTIFNFPLFVHHHHLSCAFVW